MRTRRSRYGREHTTREREREREKGKSWPPSGESFLFRRAARAKKRPVRRASSPAGCIMQRLFEVRPFPSSFLPSFRFAFVLHPLSSFFLSLLLLSPLPFHPLLGCKRRRGTAFSTAFRQRDDTLPALSRARIPCRLESKRERKRERGDG